MLNNLINIFLVLILCVACNSKGNAQESRLGVTNTPDILICSGNKGENYQNFLKANKIREVRFLNDAQFLDKNKKFGYDEKLLLEQINYAFPNKNSSGIAYIDIEHPYLDYLINDDINTENFKKSLKLFLNVLKFAKAQRPNVEWGYYYIPFTTYWDRTDKFFKKYKKVEEIIKQSDVLFPSIYIFYNNASFDFENISYLEDNTKEMIKIGKLYNKKVYPFIMSRYHPSNSKIGNTQISDDNFKTYVHSIMKTQYNNKKIDGLVLWNFDDYSYRINEPKIIDEFKKSRKSFDSFYNDYIINLLNIMIKER